jgi:hypothetical protein
MAAEIIKTVRESYPALRFIGKRYTDKDRDPATGMYSHIWGEWFASGRFGELEKLAPSAPEHDGAYIALMGFGADGFEYWIGMWFPPDTPVPGGFDYADAPPLEAGVCWIKGTEPEIYTQSVQCSVELFSNGITEFQYRKHLCRAAGSSLSVTIKRGSILRMPTAM